jgi:hypothetical protein
MPKKIFTQELEGTKQRGRPRKGWRKEVERDLQVLGVRRWRELVTGQNGGTLFDRPSPQQAVAPMEEEQEDYNNLPVIHIKYFKLFKTQIIIRSFLENVHIQFQFLWFECTLD